MPSPQVVSVDWGDVVTTTLENRSGRLADNVTNNNALLAKLKMRGKMRTVSGGREIYEELRYAQNQSFMWYSGTEYINISLNDTMTAARFPWKQASVAVVLSGLEDIQNEGEEAILDLIEQRTETAEATFENQMSAGVYSDGTGFGGKQIGGVGLLVSKAPTSGLVGGIDRGANTWWRNSATQGAQSASLIQAAMNTMTINLKRNSDGVDLIVADNNFYQYYLNSLQLIQRITSDKGSAGIGFTSLKYFGAGKEVDVILDGGRNGQIPTNTMYFLNTDYIFFRPSSKRNFKVIGGDRSNINQDAIVRIMAWAGNITASNLWAQGVLYT